MWFGAKLVGNKVRPLRGTPGVSTFFWRCQPGCEGTKRVEFRKRATPGFLPAGKSEANVKNSSYRQENGAEFS